jgi:hypothetical protein
MVGDVWELSYLRDDCFLPSSAAGAGDQVRAIWLTLAPAIGAVARIGKHNTGKRERKASA